MAIYDITLDLRAGMPTYPGEPEPSLQSLKQISSGDSANVSAFSMGAHTGTHVDAPCHFIGGAPAVHELPLGALVGPCAVIELPSIDVIGRSHLETAAGARNAARLLLKTKNSGLWASDQFHQDFAHISPDAAAWLLERRALLVGIDYLSIEQFHSPTHQVHRMLLEAGVVILEGLDLRAVSPGAYTLVCAPLKLVGSDGAPARVFLLD